MFKFFMSDAIPRSAVIEPFPYTSTIFSRTALSCSRNVVAPVES
jgi:hypothetical protein